MAQATRTRLVRVPIQEQEVHVITNPSDQYRHSKHDSHFSRSSKLSKAERKRLAAADYEAPLTAENLRPDSRWLIVRRNLHRIRFMGYNERERDSTLPGFYIGLQMKRELKRAQDEIQNIDKEKNFYAIKQFALAVDSKRIKTYDTSHVKPDDALIYDRLGDEPLPLQNLLYYFSKQDVPHETLFWDFLNEVNHVLNLKRKRTVLVERLRTLALTLAIIFYSIIGFMLFLLVISVITTATKMDDPEVNWMGSNVNNYSKNILSF
jgi:hypothetical protein